LLALSRREQGASSYLCCSMILRCSPGLLARSAVRERLAVPSIYRRGRRRALA
jgi:hypothetical protein